MYMRREHNDKTSTIMKSVHQKPEMHPRNPHNNGYDFVALAKVHAPLSAFLANNPYGKLTIDFAQPSAVKALNAALLNYYYQVQAWDIPDGYLCPAVPGRADYVHYIADLLTSTPQAQTALAPNQPIKGLDIGTGANLIYPIVASQSYQWQMLGSDIQPQSLANAQRIIDANPNLQSRVAVRLQTNPNSIFAGIIKPGEYYAFSMCNPPFHISAEAAASGSRKKNRNLARHQHKRRGKDSVAQTANQSKLNFGGQHNELWCTGGELQFVANMMKESVQFKQQVGWFTSLLSKKEHVATLNALANSLGAVRCTCINMAQGAKASRFIAWRF